MWTCPTCHKEFRNKNQWHSCAKENVEDHLGKASPKVLEAAEKLLAVVKEFDNVQINPVKSSIQVKAGATFLSLKILKSRLEIEFQLGREVDQFPIHRTIRVSKNRVLHLMALNCAEDVDDQLMEWLEESYQLVRNQE